MDLNINNYSIDDLLKIFNINISAYELNKLDKFILENELNNKIENLKNINGEDLQNNDVIENKTILIDFFYKSYIKIINTVNENTKNNIIEQDNHFLINHKESSKLETFNTNYKSGVINPLTIKTLKKIININTRFRDNYNNTLSTDFAINLPYPLKKVLKMKVINYDLPNTVYTVSCKLGSNAFYIDNSLIMLQDGSYDADSIVDEINMRISDISLNITLDYCETSGKMFFTHTDNAVFTLNFNFIEHNSELISRLPKNINKEQLTLGWLLGFRGSYINKKLKKHNKFDNIYRDNYYYESESIYDTMGNNYFLLSVDDYHNNHNAIFMSPFQCQSLADNNILARISCNCREKIINYPERIYFGPTDINKLYIKIYDEFGRIIDVNNADLSIELECEIMYDL